MRPFRALVRPRARRPHLSTRYQILRQRGRTATTQATSPSASSTASRQPSFLKRHFSKIVWAWLGTLLGVAGGTLVSQTLAPPRLPDPGSREDGILMADLDKRIDSEFKVKVLRGKCLGVAKQLKGEVEGGWVELVGMPSLVESELESSSDDNGSKEKDLLGLLQGAKGFGVERVFWNRGDKELLAIVWFGGSVCGWPGNAHGGAIATQLTEKLALANLLSDDDRSDVLAAATPQRLPGTGNHAKMLYPATKADEPQGLTLSYVKPTRANQFFVIRTSRFTDSDQDAGRIIPLEKPRGGQELEATMETLDAKLCIKARATFPPSKNAKAIPGSSTSTTDAMKTTYADFREWLWPSRQKGSQLG